MELDAVIVGAGHNALAAAVQNFLFRPFTGWARYRTPVKDLFVIGSSTWPGAGTGAGSGYMLARMLAGR